MHRPSPDLNFARLVAGTADSDIEDMCRKLLANTVIENYRIERAESAGSIGA